MDFFAQQDKVRNSSLLLLVLFIVAVTVLSLVVAWFVSIVNNIIALERDYWQLTTAGLIVAGCFWVAIGFGCFFRWLDVRGGGSRLAERFGATKVDPATRNSNEKLLLSVAAEMAVAASIPEPHVFIMRREHVINAFVVGGRDDVALVVTSGALNDLDRDELQAVVGHEMGHIVQGDLPINMRLLMALSGFMALNEIGDTFGENFVGSIFRFVGSICVFTGSILRSAFSRRREFLADAMAVQFTRNPEAMASALSTVLNHQDPETLECRYRQELAHLCFNGHVRKNWFARKLATHPRLQDRIEAIDPFFSVKKRTRKRALEKSETLQNTVADGPAIVSAADTMTATPLDALTSHPGMQVLKGSMTMAAMSTMATSSGPLSAANDGNSSASDSADDVFGCRIDLMVPDAKTSLAAVFALFASEDQKERQEYLNSIAFAYKKPFADKVQMLEKTLGAEFRSNPLLVLQHASRKLRAEVKPENRRHLLKNLEKLVEIEHETTLVNYACMTLLRRWLNVDYPVLTAKAVEKNDKETKNDRETENVQNTSLSEGDKEIAAKTSAAGASARKIPRVDAMGAEIGLLLSLLLEASGNRNERNLDDYRRVMLSYTKEYIPLRSQHEKGIVPEMQVAFESILVQQVSFRKAFIEHCREVVVADHEITARENLLLTLFASALDVELPAQPFSSGASMGVSQVANF